MQECWIFLVSKNYCGWGQKRSLKRRRLLFLQQWKKILLIMLAQRFLIHASSGTKTDILDSGSAVTWNKKKVVEEIPEPEKPRPQWSWFNQVKEENKRFHESYTFSYTHRIMITSPRYRLSCMTRFLVPTFSWELTFCGNTKQIWSGWRNALRFSW